MQVSGNSCLEMVYTKFRSANILKRMNLTLLAMDKVKQTLTSDHFNDKTDV